MKKESGRKIIAERIDEFEKNKTILTKKGHGETNIRSNYIDIMFKALGWDMKSHYEVVREFSQRDKSTDGGTKKVDYAFKINGKLKFFIEAKEASVDLEKDKSSIYQAKRYAYSSNGKAPIVILTDFEEFRVFNVIKAPLMDNTDRELLKSHTMRYSDYLEKWDLLWDTFSREAVENGSLDKLRGKIDKNTKTMDVDFLEQITSWRELLAKNIAIRNENLNVDEINEAVQRILDRLVFIRNLEDREIEPENTLLDKTKKSENIYKSLIPIFNSLNTTYNGLLFKKHFSEEIDVDDKTIHDIIRLMNYPVSPFQFDVIEPEILGRIYEKFLGSKIRLTDSHRAKIEEKIEVRKAGGVYYTPEYIVEYIVKNTVGTKIESLTPEEIKNIKILDPACGSGSFLIGAYAYLLDYHQKWYADNQKDKSYQSDWYKTKDGEIKVSLDKRGDILRNNIFGVDIDKEATEVAIMSLYLKMLDDGFDLGQKDLYFSKGSVLPDMIENIKCGNSLIEDDFYNGKSKFTQEEKNKINAFNYKDQFKKIFSNKGFDCVIGNPPWVFTKYVDWGEPSKAYIEEKYLNVSDSISIGKARQAGKINLYSIFILRSLQLLKPNGLFSFIIPNTILRTTTYDIIRKQILLSSQVNHIIDLKSGVFEGVTASTIILNLKNNEPDDGHYIEVIDQPQNSHVINNNPTKILQKKILTNVSYAFNIFVEETEDTILSKYMVNSISLGDIVNVYNGIATGPNKVGLHDSCVNSKCKKILLGRDIKNYYHEWNNNWIEYDPKILHRSRNENIFLADEKLIMQRIGGILITSYDNEQYYTFNSVNNLLLKNTDYSLKYILALLNSKAMRYYYIKNYTNKSNLTVNISKTYLDKLPIPKIDSFQKERVELSNSVIKSVDEIIETIKFSKTVKSDGPAPKKGTRS